MEFQAIPLSRIGIIPPVARGSSCRWRRILLSAPAPPRDAAIRVNRCAERRCGTPRRAGPFGTGRAFPTAETANDNLLIRSKVTMDPHATAAASRHESPRTSDRAPAVADALLRLDGLERVVVSLHHLEGLRLSDIALVLDLGEVEVARLHARALASLRAAEPVAHRQAA